ncbi:MAG: SDR family oxidoreductase [Patescibacteria group bacterium]
MPIKTILVVGAAGKSGLEVVKEALKRGYKVKALVRTPAKLGDYQNKVEVVQGDATIYDNVLEAVSGVDAVVSVIGATPRSRPGMQPLATENIIKSMQEKGIKRLITMTGAGVRTSGDQPKFMDKLVRATMKLVARKIINDAEDHAEVVKSSDLDWTVVRVPILTDDIGTGKYNFGKVGDPQMSLKICRADAALFIIEALDKPEFYKQMPMVSW